MRGLLLATLVAAGCGAAVAQGDGIEWKTDLEAARREAAATGRPLCIVFR